ncbi:MAG TPA: hypothetical protein VF520_04610 [Thermoleophilaceae bacterium]|jgi:hypothetical protein
MKARLVAVLCGAMVLGVAAPAHALSASTAFEHLTIIAAPGEKNILTVLAAGQGGVSSSFVIVESGTGTTQAGPGCTKAVRVLRCDVASAYPFLTLSLGDKADTAAVSGQFEYWEVYGGSGNDRVDLSQAPASNPFVGGGWIGGGDGRDHLDTRNNSPDIVDCGAGADIARADGFDGLTSCRTRRL